MAKYLMLRKRHMTLLLALLVVVMVTITGFAWNYKTVTVKADGQTYTIKTHLNSTNGILHDAGVPMGVKDAVLLSTPTLQDGTVLTVLRAFPVHVTIAGQTKTVMTVQRTAQGLADELGYGAPNYTPLGNENEILKANSSVNIARVTERSTQTYTRPIEVVVEKRRDDTMFRGQEVVVQTGRAGSEKVEEQILYENGKEIKRQVIKAEVVTPMEPTIIRVGSRETVTTSRGEVRFREMMTMTATAYLPTDGGGHGITASGMRARYGVVAVDPAVIPLGTRLFIPGYGLAVAADTGGDIVGNRIDLVMEDYSSAMAFGRREVDVYVLE